MKGVKYFGRNIVVDLDTRPLDNGRAHLPEDWAKISKKAKSKGEFYIGNFPLYASLICRAYELRNEASIRWGNIFRDILFSDKRLNVHFATLTKIIYDHTKNQDTVVHNFGMNEERSFKREMIPRIEHDCFDPRIKQKHLREVSSISPNKIYQAFSWILDQRFSSHGGTDIWTELDLNKCERFVSFNKSCDWNSGRYSISIAMNANNDEHNLMYGLGVRIRY